jgi:hypothetical protein
MPPPRVIVIFVRAGVEWSGVGTLAVALVLNEVRKERKDA